LNNMATTGHKLQGMSKDNLVIYDWNYSVPNWTYVVLSRVKTIDGLYLCREIDSTQTFQPPQELLAEDQRLQQLEEQTFYRRCI
ncbi:MAG: hypothetical protein ACRDL7_15650, partial [Gaiellaceae bacterium]